MPRTGLSFIGKAMLLGFLCSVPAFAKPIDVTVFNQKTFDNGNLISTPVKGYDAPKGEAGLFPAGNEQREGYRVTLQPGQAVLIVDKQLRSSSNPQWVVALDYSITGGAQTAAVGLNAPKGTPDGQLGYTVVPSETEDTSGSVHTLYTVYTPPSNELLGAVQVALPKEAKKEATVTLYSISYYSFQPTEPSILKTDPPGTFAAVSDHLLINVNGDRGEAAQDAQAQRLVLSVGGNGEAANAGVQVMKGSLLEKETLLLANVDVSKLSGADGMAALVLTDGAWHSGVFVSSSGLATSPQATTITAGGTYRPSEKPLWVIAQNGGGAQASKLAVNNLTAQVFTFDSIAGWVQPSTGEIAYATAVALILPKALYSGSQGSFSLTVRDANTHTPLSIPFDVRLTHDGQEISLGQGVTDQYGFAAKTFTVPAGAPGTWNVEVRTVGETILSGNTELKNGGVLFIETDKPIYKPGQTLHGRALFLNNALQPLTGEVEISISDAKGIKIHKQTLQTDAFGVAAFDLPLANELNFGTWKIIARSGTDTQAEKDIEVDRYVLPSYEVKLSLPKDWFLVDEKIAGSVESQYFFGKPVQGKAHLEALRYVGTWQTYATADGQLDNGVFTFSLPPVQYVAGTPAADGAGSLQIKATVTDDTGHEEKTDFLAKIVSSGVTIQLIPDSPVIKPGLNQEVLVVTQTPGGSPLSLEVQLETLFYAQDGSETGSLKTSVHTDNGTAIYRFDVPEKTTGGLLTANAVYESKTQQESLVLNAAYSPGAHFIHLRQRISGTLAVGSEAVFDVLATDNGTVYYDVYANGRTVFSNATEKREIRFPVSPEMSLQSKLVAYMIQPDNEVSADALPFQVNLTAPVGLNLQFNTDEAQPGAPVTLSLRGEGEVRCPRLTESPT